MMRRAGLVVWEAHQAAGRLVKPGVSTAEINQAIRDVFAHYNAEPLFLNYPGPEVPFPAETCILVNEQVVHGIPGNKVLQEGDIVSIDTGCRIDGWCGDAAITHAVGKISQQAQHLLDVTSSVLRDLPKPLGGPKDSPSGLSTRKPNVSSAAESSDPVQVNLLAKPCWLSK